MQNTFLGIVLAVLGAALGYAFADTIGIIGGGLLGAAAGFVIAAARQQAGRDV